VVDDPHDDSVPEAPAEIMSNTLPAGRLAGLRKALRAPRPTPQSSSDATGRAIAELDERERRLSIAGIVLGTGLVVSGYLVDRGSHVEKVRAAASTLLIAGIVVLVIMVLGVIFRRRAMVGFASFMVGFALITGGNIFGVLFLGFGGWLLVRALRRQRGEGKPAGTTASKRKPPPKPAGPPKPSKRYTPPRRAGAGSRRR
jgi:hypothetical protein